jgi:hypothetical protein
MRHQAAQFRAARAALLLKTKDIAAAARMSPRTLNEIEQADQKGAVPPAEAAVLRLTEFYRRQGVTFLPSKGQGFGVRFNVK